MWCIQVDERGRLTGSMLSRMRLRALRQETSNDGWASCCCFLVCILHLQSFACMSSNLPQAVNNLLDLTSAHKLVLIEWFLR
jgi:hypothetical protein